MLHFESVRAVFDPSACRCHRGCWDKAGFSVGDIVQSRYPYVQLESERARSSFLASRMEKPIGGSWQYFLPAKPQQDVCSQFFVRGMGISHNKLGPVRSLVATGSTPGPHANTGKSYITKKQGKSVTYAFWASFYEKRCQKPSE